MGATLVLGGIRSGKSRIAESLLPPDRTVRYLATGASAPEDAAWAERVATHRSRRPDRWVTTETTDIPAELRTGEAVPTLLDDLGGWLTATLDSRGAWGRGGDVISADIGELVNAIGAYPADLVIVSPEVGLTVVPATASGRLFADELGALNQAVAQRCERVLLVVAGQPLAIKGAPRVSGEAPQFAPVTAPSPDMADAARDRQRQLTKPAGALGRLEELSVWAAACQNQCPPEVFQRPRVVVFAGDHGVAASGVSAYPPSVTAQMVRNIDAGGAAVNVLATLAGAGVRVVDVAVGRPSGNIAVQDALTAEQTHAALATGIALADAEIDAGADLLIAGDMGIGNTTPATVLVAALTGTEPVALVGRGTGVDDEGWARKTAAVRDALYRSKDVRTDPVALLGRAGGADLAALTGFVAQAAVRRTPVLLDGLVVTAAALVAEQLAPGARQWWLAGHRSTEPAHSVALQRLRLDPVLDLQMRLGEGSGALVALPVLQAAVGTLSRMATFDEAGVDGANS